MKITNKHSLPQSLVNVVSNHKAPVPGRYSVTDIINPPLLRLLKEQHWGELEQDVSDMLWMILGSSVHHILERGSPDESLAEEKMVVSYNSSDIVGVPDLWHDREISDWKVTSVWSFRLGEKIEWEIQLNIYKWMYEQSGFEVDKLTINAILRDWVKSKSFDHDYPKIAFHTLNIPLWDHNYVVRYIGQWIYRLRNDPHCTDEEKWARPTRWAVMKKGQKKAIRVLDSKEEAEKWKIDNLTASDVAKSFVQERKGEFARCKEYCQVRDVCPDNVYRG